MILIDGRVFGTSAAHRGMGNFVCQLISQVIQSGNKVCLILPKNSLRKFENFPTLVTTVINFEEINCSELIQKTINELQPEIYIDATPFLSPQNTDFWGTKIVSIVYDLIPILYPSFYLTSKAAIDSYLNGLHRAITADGLIFISERTEKDFRTYFMVNQPSIVIHPSGELDFSELNKSETEVKILSSVGMHSSKNPYELAKALNELAKIDDDFSAKVVVSSEEWAEQFKLLIETSKIEIHSEISLNLYSVFFAESNIYIHSSVEEGFGIPLANAINANCAVVLANNDINKEICNFDSAYWFDPSQPGDLSRVLKVALNDFRAKELKISRRNRVRNDNFEVLKFALKSSEPVKRVNWLGPLPPQNCGIADYSEGIIEQMPQNRVVNYFNDQPPIESLYLNPNFKWFPLKEIENRRLISSDAVDIYQIAAADWFKPYIQDLLIRDSIIPARVVVHDHYFGFGLYQLFGKNAEFFLKNFVAPELDGDFFREVEFAINHGSSTQIQSLLQSRPILKWLSNRSLEFFSHATTEHLGLISEMHAMPSKIPKSLLPLKDSKFRHDDSPIILGCFGRVAPNKYILETLNALVLLRRYGVRVELIIVGEPVDATYMQKILDFINRHELQNNVVVIGYTDEVKYWKLLKTVHILISLRDSSRGGLSAVLTNGIILGKPIIASDIQEHRNQFLRNIIYIDNSTISENLASAVLHWRRKKEIIPNSYSYTSYLERLFR